MAPAGCVFTSAGTLEQMVPQRLEVTEQICTSAGGPLFETQTALSTGCTQAWK